MSIYCDLTSNLSLRSWKNQNYKLYNLKTGIKKGVSLDEFQALSFCDGKTDIDSLFVLDHHKKIILDFKKLGIVEFHEEKAPKKQNYINYDNDYVDMIHWSITGKCNYKCRHCFLSAPEAKYGELSFDQCVNIINQFEECGISNVSITGGEPLFRKDFFDLLDVFYEKNINISTIYSNGSLINERLLNKLEEKKIKPMFSLSFDGVGWHDWLRGVKGAEEKAVNAFKLLNDRGFPIDVEMCIHKNNAHSLEKTIDLLSKLGVESIKTNPVSDSGLWINEHGKYNIERKELFNLYLDYIPKFLKAGSPLNLHLGGFFYCEKGSKNYTIPLKKFDGTEKSLKTKICEHARNTMYICPDGQVLPCMSLAGLDKIITKKEYVTEMSLKTILNNSNYNSLMNIDLGKFLRKNKECSECKYKFDCGGGCRASATETAGNYLGCDEVACDIFKKGYVEKIKKAVELTM